MARQLVADDRDTRALWDDFPEERARVPENPARNRRPAEDDALGSRIADLEIEPESPFLRAQKRVPVRRGPVTKKTASRLRRILLAATFLSAAAIAAVAVYRYGEHAARFRIASSEQIAIDGTQHVARSQIMEVFGSDIGRNTFFVPLEKRQQQIEQLAWVQSAGVMRLLPDRLRVEIVERTPIAFAQVGSRIQLIDSEGVLLDSAGAKSAHYSFPVITGMSDAEPRSTRAARMKLYQRLIDELDSGGSHYSQDISEADLSDPEDLKITVADEAGPVLLHLGDTNFLDRFKIYIAHVEGWRQQFHKLNSVDLRFEQQVIVNPDVAAQPPAPSANDVTPPATPIASKPAAIHPAAHPAAARRRWHAAKLRRASRNISRDISRTPARNPHPNNGPTD
jgi:cell division protein FtsQ